MDRPIFAEEAFALATLALKNDEGAFVNMHVDPDARRAAAVALIAIPWSRGLLSKKGTCRLTSGILAAVAQPYLSSVLRHLR